MSCAYYIASEYPSQLAEGELTQMYVKYREQNIIKQPENRLWSHRK